MAIVLGHHEEELTGHMRPSDVSLLIHSQNLHGRWGEQDFAEGVEKLTRLFARSETSAPELVELVEAVQLKLELEGSSGGPPRERDEEASVEAARSSRLDLLSHKVHRSLAIDRQNVVREARDVHANLLSVMDDDQGGGSKARGDRQLRVDAGKVRSPWPG
jgi:hypothetical protein